MHITLTTPSGEFAAITADPATTIQTIKLVAEVELRIPAAKQAISFKGVVLTDQQSLGQAGVQSDDMLLVSPIASSAGVSLDTIPQELFRDPRALQQYIKSNPSLMEQLLRVNPTMAEAILAPDHHMLEAYLIQQAQARQRRQMDEMKEIEMLNADPFNPENQAKIAELIRKQNVQENMEKAIEFNPESFGRVVMLYVPCRVNNADITAFVDSGAQSTIMSKECAARCGLLKWLDERFAGVAKGVGTAKILGRVHAAQLQMGKAHFQCSITVIENQDMDFLFGLDQLKRHQACIDLKENCLKICGESIPFLSEKDLPSHIRHEDSGTNSASSSSSAGPMSSSAPPVAASPLPSVSPSVPNASAGAASAARSLANPNRPVGAAATAGAPSSSAAGARPAGPVAPVPTRGVAPNQAAEDKIQRLMGLGFPRNQVIQALQAFGGDEEQAASYLVQSQFGF